MTERVELPFLCREDGQDEVKSVEPPTKAECWDRFWAFAIPALVAAQRKEAESGRS